MKCPCCNEEVPDTEFEPAFILPDEAARMPEEEREARTVYTADLCVIDNERFYIRGLLPLEVQEINKKLTIGTWIQVSKELFQRYLDEEDLAHGKHEGILANNIPLHSVPQEHGRSYLKGLIQFGDQETRPSLYLQEGSHGLIAVQKNGMTPGDWHRMIAPLLAREQGRMAPSSTKLN